MSDINEADLAALLGELRDQAANGYKTCQYAALRALVAERDALKQENEAQSYEGNSASHWAASSKVYGNCISDCWKVLMLAGFPPNGNIDIVASLTALVAERDALKQRVAELESHPPVDRDRDKAMELWMDQVTSMLCHSMTHSHGAKQGLVTRCDAAIAAMRKGGAA